MKDIQQLLFFLSAPVSTIFVFSAATAALFMLNSILKFYLRYVVGKKNRTKKLWWIQSARWVQCSCVNEQISNHPPLSRVSSLSSLSSLSSSRARFALKSACRGLLSALLRLACGSGGSGASSSGGRIWRLIGTEAGRRHFVDIPSKVVVYGSMGFRYEKRRCHYSYSYCCSYTWN